MEIKKAEKADLDKILEIERACFTQPWSKDSFLGEFWADESHFTVAAEGEEVIGFCILRTFEDEAELFNIAVAPEHRRKHCAETLLREALRFAVKSGAQAVFLEVRKSNEGAQKLYEKLGFRNIGVRRGYYDMPSEDAILMSRETENEDTCY